MIEAICLIAIAAMLADNSSEKPNESTGSGAFPLVSPIFGSHMVLQRSRSNPIWGWAEPHEPVSVEIDGRVLHAIAGSDGRWDALLPELPAGGPFKIVIRASISKVLEDVLVGDVWLCSGQSNMEYGLGNETDGEAQIAAGDHPNIRLYTVERDIALEPREHPAGQWQVCTPSAIRESGGWEGFSAIGYFFGRDLEAALDIPVGVIHSSWGGTPAESWTSEHALRTELHPDFDQQLNEIAQERGRDTASLRRSLLDQIDDWFALSDTGLRDSPRWCECTLDDSGWKNMTLPTYFQKSGDPDLTSMNGIVWFRRQFDIPDALCGEDLTLTMHVDDDDRTWINGVEVGATEGCGVLREYPVPSSILKPSGNIISVRVFDSGGFGGIQGEPDALCLTSASGDVLSLAGSWRYRVAADLTKSAKFPVDISNDPCQPSVLYNGMINPIAPFGLKGVLWYQGESNVSRASQYKTLLPAMITDWRRRWGQGAFPFLIVQLASWTLPTEKPGSDSWAELREAQWIVATTCPNCGIATAIDVGDPLDIHPKNKREVARRLALLARNMVYGEDIVCAGPSFDIARFAEESVELHFKNIGGGLTARDGTPTGFAIAGADQKWRWATARITGDSIVLSSPDVPRPIAARYGWMAAEIGNVFSREGWPMFPFRTDDFPLSSE